MQQSQPVVFRRNAGRPKGRQVDPAMRGALQALLADALPLRRDLLIEYLHRIQDARGCLSRPMLTALAEAMKLSAAEVWEVASFYHHFDLVDAEPAQPPPLTVRVCESLSCAMAGADGLMRALAQGVGAEVGEGGGAGAEAASGAGVDTPMPVAAVRIQPVPCVGRCDQAPVVVIGQRPVGLAQASEVLAEIDRALGDPQARTCPMPDAPDYAQARENGAYGQLQRLHRGEFDAAMLFDRLETSGLRGMGGAGFPTGRKWRIVAAEPAPRLLVVNADEGEPGTFKDRVLLEQDPHAFLEGMLIAALAVQAQACYLYLRDEYPGLHALLAREIAALRADPPIPLAVLPDIHLRRGAGAYICGEESALIESLEGKRGMPRLRPPYVAQVGLFGRPTLVNNVETLAWVPRILSQGDAAFAQHGRRGRRGLRAFSVSGRVRTPGVHLAPAGISLRELIEEHCGGMASGHTLYGYLPGGASGGILPASLADLPLDFDTLQAQGCFIGSAAIIVLSQADSAREAAARMMAFFQHESCGQCTPCRVGTAKAQALLREPRWDVPLLTELSATMADASICGLGQAAPNPVLSVMRHFPQELSASVPTSPEAAR